VVRIVLIFDRSFDVDAKAMAEEWAKDDRVQPHLAGPPTTLRPRPTTYLPGVVEFVVIPLAINLGSSLLIEITKQLLRRHRPGVDAEAANVEEVKATEDEVTLFVGKDDSQSRS
jgi:hypothetical protein